MVAPPYRASFTSGNFDFIVITAHIQWVTAGGRELELRQLAPCVDESRPAAHAVDPDILVMGDFNIPDRTGELHKAVNGLPTQEKLIGRMQLLPQQIRANDEAAHQPDTSDATIKALGAVYEGLGDQLKTTMQQLTSGLPGGGMSPVLPDAARGARDTPPKTGQPPAMHPATAGTATPAASGQ